MTNELNNMSPPSGDANLLRTTLRKQQRDTMAGQHLPVLNSCPSTSAHIAASVPGQATDQRWDGVDFHVGDGPSQLAQIPSERPAPQMDTGGKMPSLSLAQMTWGPRKEARACQALQGKAGSGLIFSTPAGSRTATDTDSPTPPRASPPAEKTGYSCLSTWPRGCPGRS